MEPRIKGHKACHEPRQYVRKQQVATATGIVICECGTFSPQLPSAIDRIRWHRQHLADVISGKAQLL